MTSSGSELSEKPVKPRRSQNNAVISRRWLSSCFSVPDATIRSATCGGKKRRPTHALDLTDLIGNALLELLIQLVEIIEQPRVLDGDDGLGGEISEQIDLLLGERAHFLAINADHTNQLTFLQHRDSQHRAGTGKVSKTDQNTIALKIRLKGSNILNVYKLFGFYHMT